MRAYRAISLALAAAFAAVGAIFLAAPGLVRSFVDLFVAGSATAMPPGDVESGLFRALAVGYMYLVTLFAWMMFRHPAEPVWPTLLAHAKLASAVLSLALYVAHRPYVVYVGNGVVDGAIGLAVLLLRRRAARWQKGPWR